MAAKVDVLAALANAATFATAYHLPNSASDYEAAHAAIARLIEAARDYYADYCQDEAAADGPEFTGCSQEQAEAARALRDALLPIAGNRIAEAR